MLAANLRRIMADQGLLVDDVAERANVNRRTVLGILASNGTRPHARTLHRLAAGLGVPAAELLRPPPLWAQGEFDRRTNPAVDELASSEPARFADWTAADFDELCSRFGAGGELTIDGARQAVDDMNRKREVHRKVDLVLETAEADLLAKIVDTLYERVIVRE